MEFKNLGDLINQVNSSLGEFCNEFGRKRKELAGLGKVPKKGVLFIYDASKERDWAINEGGGTELQYHLAFDVNNLEIKYGLGFNTQYVPFANKMSTIDYLRPFMNGFLKHENKIKESLPDYYFVYGNIERLRHPQDGEYTLFGKKVSANRNTDEYSIEDTAFNSIIEDLKKQFEAYIIIFKEKNNFKEVTMDIQNSIDVLKQKGQIILQGPPGTGKTYTAKNIAEQIIFSKISDDKKQQKTFLESTEQFKLIQFHPAYSYEDFVRGIVAESDGNVIEYKTKNKALAEFAKKAHESNLSGGVDDFDRAWSKLIREINTGIVTKIDGSNVEVDINGQGNIRFKSPVATYERTYELYKFGKTNLKYETYQKIVLNHLIDKYSMKNYVSPELVVSNKPYVLIIDEINRANLPAVLGELIYAMEYRGEKVDSMYATVEDGNTLILPQNLYIIGTMNTSDRSVGHIDYAIRRRFAFIDILPKVLDSEKFELRLFKQVSALFIQNFDEYMKNAQVELKPSEYLSGEFRPEDVWLGHSYFIKNDSDFELRKKYEIIPILKEYIKDGILKQSAEPIINEL